MKSVSDGSSDSKTGSARSASEFLRSYDDDSLAAHLVDCRGKARQIMHEFNIPMGHICEMARQADERISDTALRAEFLHILIDVHEFGREVKRRGVAVAETGSSRTEDTQQARRPETSLFAPTMGASDDVSDGASRDFFASLDAPRNPKRTARRQEKA